MMKKIALRSIFLGILCFFCLLITAAFKPTKTPIDLLKNIIMIIKRDYVESKDEMDLIHSAIKGMLYNIDPYSSYLSNKEVNDLKLQSKGEFEGIGIEIAIDNDMVRIISPIEGMPAYNAGLKPGDIISSIDGKQLKGLSLSEVADLMRGKSGTSVKLSIMRNFSLIELDIIRAQININSVFVQESRNIIYSKISSFIENSDTCLKKEIKKILKKPNNNVIGIIIDLRNNPGGLLDQAINIADLFLSEGRIIVSTINKNKDEVKNFYSSNLVKLTTTIPIVVMINEGSASASEILAAALRDNDRAIILGKKSFGKASVQTIMPLDNKLGAVKITTAYYYTPSGKSIQGHGIVPDIEIPQSVDASPRTTIPDQQLEKAFDILYSFSVFDNIKNNKK